MKKYKIRLKVEVEEITEDGGPTDNKFVYSSDSFIESSSEARYTAIACGQGALDVYREVGE